MSDVANRGRMQVEAMRGLSWRAPVVGLLVLATFVVAPAVLATHNTGNSHTTNGIYHGWVRNAVASQYNFHAWTEHGHGSKFATVTHADGSHSHCGVIDNVDHVHCESLVGNCCNHDSGHKAPSGSAQRYNDGHGVELHEMEAILS